MQETTVAEPDSTHFARWRLAVVIGGCVIAALLIFTRLGHYALWDDESNTALFGQGVWRTGDTSAVLDDLNVIAYRGGRELKGLHNRYMPPLQYYLEAPFVGLFGHDTFWVRFPFAMMGLATIALILWMAARRIADPQAFVALAVAITCNTALILYFRQCRYFALAIFLHVVTMLLYQFAPRRWRWMVLGGVVLFLLLATNYLAFAATCAVLLVDYLVWGRRSIPIPSRMWAALLGPSIVLGVPLLLMFNPLGVNVVNAKEPEPWYGRLKIIWWAFKDVNASEMLSWTVMIAAIAFALPRRGVTWIRRLGLASGVFILTCAILSPQRTTVSLCFDIRYLSAALPLFASLTVAVAMHATRQVRWAAVPLVAVLTMTNIANFGSWTTFPYTDRSGLPRVTFLDYIGELSSPPTDPFRALSDWINSNLPPRTTVAVHPNSTVYPLMFHSPQMQYAWQLEEGAGSQFTGFADIHYVGREWPTCLVAMSPYYANFVESLRPADGRRYQVAAVLPVYGLDAYRPEIQLRSFRKLPAPGLPARPIIIYLLSQRPATPTTTESR